jgi:PAS domain S-box-containing protein
MPISRAEAGLNEHHKLQRLIFWGAGVCGALLCAVAFLIAAAFPGFGQLSQLRQQVSSLSANVKINEEKLTSAARLYVATGNPDAIADYDPMLAQLDADLKRLQALFDAPEMAAAVAALDSANRALVESETFAFALVEAGKLKAARDMVFGPAYQTQKDAYAAALAQVLTVAQSQLAAKAAITRRGGQALLGLLGLIMVSMAALVGVIVFAARRHLQIQKDSRRHAEEVGDRMSFALAAFGAGVCELSVAQRRLFVSDNFNQILGENLTFEMMAERDFMIVHPDERARMKALIQRCQETGEMIHVDTRILRPDGSVIWVEVKGQMRTNADGGARGFVCMLIDITERKNREAQLHAALVQAEAALDEQRRALAAMDADMETAPNAASEGDAYSDMMRRLALVLREIQARDAAMVAALAAREEARDAAEQANRAKSQFLANMSHELRTPLNAVIGYAEILDEDLEAEGLETSRKDVMRIRSSARHLLNLINEILDLSKIEAGRMDVAPSRFDVAGFVAETVETIAPTAVANGNQLRLDIDPEVGEACTDLQKLKQCLLNLLSNAAKFTRDGDVSLCARRRRSNGRDWLDLVVSDNGVGMTGAQVAKLFQPFVQADAQTSREFGGTGLGLAITRRLAQLLGGDVAVASEHGVGSVFTLSVPADFEVLIPESSAVAGADGPVVLVIDDAVEARDLVRRALARLGFDVRSATTLAEGLEQAQTLRPAAIVLDVGLPDGSGWDLLQTLKADDALRATPVIVHSIEDDATRSLALGAVMHLRKPVDRAELAAAVARFARTPAVEGPKAEGVAAIRAA